MAENGSSAFTESGGSKIQINLKNINVISMHFPISTVLTLVG